MRTEDLLRDMRAVEMELRAVKIRIDVLNKHLTMLDRRAENLLEQYRKERGEVT